ncbi:MAG: DUF86 domain-containing protein [Thermodesulfovibrionales bacterium]|jgi:uncharacterized protein with HEPN domain
MRKRTYLDYLNDILQSIDDVGTFIKGMSFKDFLHDKKTINAVVRSIEIVGEAANHIPKVMRDKTPDVPWREIVGMRNKIVHEYFGVDNEIVWKTAKHYLPKLKSQLATLVKQGHFDKWTGRDNGFSDLRGE